MSDIDDGLVSCLRQDVRMWARVSKTKASIGYVFRYLIFEPGFYFIFCHRLVRTIGKLPIIGRVVARAILLFVRIIFSSDVKFAAKLGPGIYAPHPYCIVIGANCVIEGNASLMHGITLGTVSQTDPSIPYLEKNVVVGTGSVVLGAVRLGEGCSVGANSVVLKDVPPHAAVVGIPAKALAKRSDSSSPAD